MKKILRQSYSVTWNEENLKHFYLTRLTKLGIYKTTYDVQHTTNYRCGKYTNIKTYQPGDVVGWATTELPIKNKDCRRERLQTTVRNEENRYLKGYMMKKCESIIIKRENERPDLFNTTCNNKRKIQLWQRANKYNNWIKS